MTWSSRALRRAGGRTLGLALVWLAAPRSGQAAQQPAATLDTIIVLNHSVFDPADHAPGFVARLANALHVTTRASVIRRVLLVNPGDRYDSARVAESERALRLLGVFSRVRIDTTRVHGRLALQVATTDGWSTQPQLSYSTAGGDATWLFGMVEQNLLGTATALTAVHNRTPDRSSFDLGYVNSHFVSRRARLQGLYSDKSDGKRGDWFAGVPFYETGTPRAFTTTGEAASERVLVFRDGVLSDSLAHRALRFGIAGGVATHATSRDYVRLWLGAQWRREDFAPNVPTAAVPRSVFGTIGGGLDVGHVRYQVLERFNSYARREDVDISQLLHIGVWAAPHAWGYAADRAGLGPEVSAQVSGAWRGGFAVLSGAGNGVFTTGTPDSGRVSGALTVASQNLPGQTLVVHLEGARLRRPAPDAPFDLWVARKGPRLFGIHAFTGTRMVWLAVEDRVLVADELWSLVGVGVAPFLDYGGAWYPDETARLGGDIGVALRIGPTRAIRGDVGEFAVGYRFGAGIVGSRWGLAVRRSVTY
ncbi:MAG TPA: POTRA domain-containing protein [Gemmatimonadales bacterium]|nr:POTRA domain-containing protein [Gemmatimonadales bacterium]